MISFSKPSTMDGFYNSWLLSVLMVGENVARRSSSSSSDKEKSNTLQSIPHDQSTELISHQHQEPKRIIHRTLVHYGAVVFSKPGLDTYKALVIDTANGTTWKEGIYVGARNFMIKFNLSLRKPIALKLPVSPEQNEKCKAEGKPVDDCQNFIKFLKVTKIGDQGTVIACGTYAHSPKCYAVLATSLTEELRTEVRRLALLSPGDPHVEVASYVINDKVYVGLSAEPQGSKGKILYTTWNKYGRTIRSIESKSWVDDVQFVRAFSPTQEHKFVYFVFRELAIDAQTPNQMYTRVGRICKEDRGGEGYYKDYFSSFTKAYMACGGYDLVQDVSYNENDMYFWATFSGGERINGSSICCYEIDVLESVFGGYYFHPDPDDERWKDTPTPKPFDDDDYVETCYGIRAMKAVVQNTMMNTAVSPYCKKPLFVTNVTLNKIATAYEEDNGIFVVFSGDELGRVWRMDFTDMYSKPKDEPSVCTEPKDISIWEVIPASESSKGINRLRVFNDSLIVLTNKAVMKIPVWYNYPEEKEKEKEEEPTTTTTNTGRTSKSSSILTEGRLLEVKNETSAVTKRTRQNPNSQPRLKFSCSQTTLFVLTALLTF